MTKIFIKDLSDNIELDQAAMRAIAGGARTPGSSLALRLKQEEKSRSSLVLVDQARKKMLARR